MGGLSLADALLLCELLAKTEVARYERAALRWLQRFIDQWPPFSEVALAGPFCVAGTRFCRSASGGWTEGDVSEVSSVGADAV
jgi:hypothetical protein